MIRSGDTQYGLILVMTIKSYNVAAGIRKRPRRFSSCNALDSSWPVAPRGCRDCCAPIGSDLSKTGHAVGAVNPPQMTHSGRGAKKHDAAQQAVVGSRNGIYGMFCRKQDRSRLDARKLHHLGPLLR